MLYLIIAIIPLVLYLYQCSVVMQYHGTVLI